MVTLQILVLPFLVRVQVGQQREIRRALDVESGALFMFLYKGVGREKKRKERSLGKICDNAKKRKKRGNGGA